MYSIKSFFICKISMDYQALELMSENYVFERSFDELQTNSTSNMWAMDASTQPTELANCPILPDYSPKSRRVSRRCTNESGRTKKTEELDKFWLRAFREYIKKQYLNYCFTTEDSTFWEEYWNEAKLPGKGREFRSYGKSYKNWLFEHMTFAQAFADWFEFKGREKLAEKRSINSAIFDEYFGYASSELLTWHERLMNS